MPSSDDLHPVGWCARTGGKNLQKPKGHSGIFSWDAYLLREKAKPVPPVLLTSPTNKLEDGDWPRGTGVGALVQALLMEHFVASDASASVRALTLMAQRLRALTTPPMSSDSSAATPSPCVTAPSFSLAFSANAPVQFATASSLSVPGVSSQPLMRSRSSANERQDAIRTVLSDLSSLFLGDSTVSAFELQNSGIIEVL